MSLIRITQTRIGWKRFLGYEPLNRRGVVLLSIVIIFMSSFSAAAPPTSRITIGTFFPHYSPKLVRIETGTPISWVNRTSTLHSITHDGCTTGQGCAFDSGPIGPNRTFRIDHLPPGYYPYHCSFHPIMRGVLVVQESGVSSES